MSSASTPTLAEQTAQYLLDVTAKREPYALLDELRDREPVHQTAAGTWIVSDYALCVAGLRDARPEPVAAVAREVDIMLDDGEARTVYKSRIMNRDGPNHRGCAACSLERSPSPRWRRGGRRSSRPSTSSSTQSSRSAPVTSPG
jgi:hypothetical protein